LNVESAQRSIDSVADPGDSILQRAADERDPTAAAKHKTRTPEGGRAFRETLAIRSHFACSLFLTLRFLLLLPDAHRSQENAGETAAGLAFL
jgi:hypothetical protein